MTTNSEIEGSKLTRLFFFCTGEKNEDEPTVSHVTCPRVKRIALFLSFYEFRIYIENGRAAVNQAFGGDREVEYRISS